MKNEKKSYETPTLKDWGKVADLTQVGKTNPGGDAHDGSVYPPGRGKPF